MTPEEEEARSRLLFHLENQTGFWFALVVGDDPRPRARLREAAEAWCKENGQAFHLHAPEPHQLSGLAAELAKPAAPGLHWIRADGPMGLIEQWDAAGSQLLLAMNERREAYRRRLDGGVIIDGRESLKRLLRELAPDLFSIRAFIAEPGIQADAGMQTVPEWREPASFLVGLASVVADPDRELQRAARIEKLEGIDARRAWIRAMMAAGSGLVLAERVDEARHCADALLERVLQWSQDQPDDALLRRALTTARVLHGISKMAQGRSHEALRLVEHAVAACTNALECTQDVGEVGALLIQISSLRELWGRLLLHAGDFVGAEAALRERLGLVAQFLRDDPANQDWQLGLLEARRDLADVLKRQGNFIAAESLLRETIQIIQGNLAHTSDARWDLEMYRCWSTLGEVLRARGNLAEAVEAYQSALDKAESLAEQDAHVQWHTLVWRTHQGLVDVFFAQGDIERTLKSVEQYILLLERSLARSVDDGTAWLLALGYAQRAEVLINKHEFMDSGEALLQAWLMSKRASVGSTEAALVQVIANLHLHVGLFFRRVLEPSADLPALFISRWVAGFLKRAVILSERALRAAPRDDAAARSVLDSAYRELTHELLRQGFHRAARRLRHKRRVLRRR